MRDHRVFLSLIAALFVTMSVTNALAVCYVNCPLGDNSGSPACPMWRTPDFDGNGVVDLVDLATFALSLPPGPFAKCCDFDCDGVVALPDLAIFALHWGHFGPFPGLCIC